MLERLGFSLECEGLVLLLDIRLDDPGAGEVLLHERREPAELRLHGMEPLLDHRPDPNEEQRDKRKGQRRQQRQLDIDREHDDEAGDEEQHGPKEIHQSGAEHLADGRHVVRDARHQVAGLVVLKKLLVERLDVCIHIVPKVVFHLA